MPMPMPTPAERPLDDEGGDDESAEEEFRRLVDVLLEEEVVAFAVTVADVTRGKLVVEGELLELTVVCKAARLSTDQKVADAVDDPSDAGITSPVVGSTKNPVPFEQPFSSLMPMQQKILFPHS